MVFQALQNTFLYTIYILFLKHMAKHIGQESLFFCTEEMRAYKIVTSPVLYEVVVDSMDWEVGRLPIDILWC